MGVSALLEFVRKFDLAEEDPWVVVLVIETILELSDALDRTVDFFVLTEHHEGGAGLSELWVEGFDVHHFHRFVFVPVLAIEKIRHRSAPAVGFTREAED
jgi:hypothetical protein